MSAEMKKAAKLDPLSTPIQSFSGVTYIWVRRYDEALAQFQKANMMNPTFTVNHERLARCYCYMGKYDDAIREETNARLLAGDDAKIRCDEGGYPPQGIGRPSRVATGRNSWNFHR